MEVSLTENGVGGACWNVGPRREGGSRKGIRSSSERTRDYLHNKFMRESFMVSGGYEEKGGVCNTELTRLVVPALGPSFPAT